MFWEKMLFSLFIRLIGKSKSIKTHGECWESETVARALKNVHVISRYLKAGRIFNALRQTLYFSRTAMASSIDKTV